MIMWKAKNKGRYRGFTLIEILVTIGIVSVLAGIGVVAIGKVRGAKSQTTCINNLRVISHGLQMYYNDYMIFPDDGYPDTAADIYPLSTELTNYINNKSTFVCPEDDNTTSTSEFASHDPYYVARKGSYDSNELAIGCPRHRGAKNSTSAFSTGSTEIMSVGAVTVSGQELPPDGTTAQRTINSVGEVMLFDDNSTVTVTNASGGSYGCFLVQSVRLSDGTLYSIVKVQDSGTIDVQVTTGSKFEVVTPSAIVGVRGTQFSVATSTNGSEAGYQTDVSFTSGIVVVTDRETGIATTLESGGTTSTITGDVPLHSHWHTHSNGERHRHVHPPQDQAHHGKPRASEDDENEGETGTILCHDPGTSDERTIEVDTSSLSAHLEHGDSLGVCTGGYSDNDGDGYTVAQGDCDDNDASISPGKTEITDNGKDDDCDSATLDSSADQALVDQINEVPPMNSSDLKSALNDESPLSSTVLLAAIDRSPAMDTSDLKDVLLNQSSLADNILLAAIDMAAPMNSSDLKDVLLEESPLAANVLQAAIDRDPAMDSGDLQSVIDAQ